MSDHHVARLFVERGAHYSTHHENLMPSIRVDAGTHQQVPNAAERAAGFLLFARRISE
jgi:hypothetical protein